LDEVVTQKSKNAFAKPSAMISSHRMTALFSPSLSIAYYRAINESQLTRTRPLTHLFKLDLADKLLGREQLALDEIVCGFEVDDAPEIMDGELWLEDLEITRRATETRVRSNARRMTTKTHR
jgi:hypothetical protein